LNIGADGFADAADIEWHRGLRGKFTVADIQCVVADSDNKGSL
jgi:hypothetical protein